LQLGDKFFARLESSLAAVASFPRPAQDFDRAFEPVRRALKKTETFDLGRETRTGRLPIPPNSAASRPA